jgi:hypothetical protein
VLTADRLALGLCFSAALAAVAAAVTAVLEAATAVLEVVLDDDRAQRCSGR